MVVVLQGLDHGAIALGEHVQLGMQVLDVQVVSQFVGYGKVSDVDEGIVTQFVLEAACLELSGQPRMTIEINGQAERRPACLAAACPRIRLRVRVFDNDGAIVVA